jgi:sugar phosphate isomerase/epimerase
MRDVGSPQFRVCFQPLDFTNTEATLTALDSVRGDIAHIHLQGRRAETLCLLEEADIDYGRVVRALAESKYSGTMSIEFVKDCVVPGPDDFDMDTVLGYAMRDREYLLTLATRSNLALRV